MPKTTLYVGELCSSKYTVAEMYECFSETIQHETLVYDSKTHVVDHVLIMKAHQLIRLGLV